MSDCSTGEYVGLSFSSSNAAGTNAGNIVLKDPDGVTRTLASNERLLIDNLSGTIATAAVPAKVTSGSNVLAVLDSGHEFEAEDGVAAQAGVTPTVTTAAAGQIDLAGVGRVIKDHTPSSRPSWKEDLTAKTNS